MAQFEDYLRQCIDSDKVLAVQIRFSEHNLPGTNDPVCANVTIQLPVDHEAFKDLLLRCGFDHMPPLRRLQQ